MSRFVRRELFSCRSDFETNDFHEFEIRKFEKNLDGKLLSC